MTEQRRILEQTVETITASQKWPTVQQTPYKDIARYLFFAGFAGGIGLASAFSVIDYYALFFSGLIAGLVAQGGTVIYIGYVTSRIYQPDRQIKTERFANEPDPQVDPARITGNNYTATIAQPKPGAFAEWTRGVLDDTQARLQFSFNEATRRGFDYNNVIGELKRIGVLESKPDGNGVYRLNQHGKKLLEDWLK